MYPWQRAGMTEPIQPPSGPLPVPLVADRYGRLWRQLALPLTPVTSSLPECDNPRLAQFGRRGGTAK